MNATKTGMASYSTQELIDYVERTDKKIEADQNTTRTGRWAKRTSPRRNAEKNYVRP
jgi:hypothetical protein